MQFLNLPFSVQTRIFDEMDHVDKFILSFCSRRTARLIRSINWNVESLQFQFNGTSYFTVVVELLNEGTITLGHLRFQQQLSERDRRTIINMQGRNFECGYQPETITRYSTITFSTTDEDGSQQLVCSHIQNLFRNSPDVELEVFHVRSRRYPRLENVREIVLDGVQTDVNTMELICRTYRDLKILKINFDVSGSLKNDSNILKIDHLQFAKTGSLAPTLIENFTGKFGYFFNSECNNETVIHFLHQWITEEKYHNLKILEISSHFNSIQIIESVNAMKYDRARRPRYYPQGVRHLSKPYLRMDCRSFWDLEHSTNGTLASFRVKSDKFQFFVWDRSVVRGTVANGTEKN